MRTAKYLSATNSIHKFVRALIYAVVVALLSAAAFATDKAAKIFPDPGELIGLETMGPFYPFSGTQIGSDGFGSSPFMLSTLRNGNVYGLPKHSANDDLKMRAVWA